MNITNVSLPHPPKDVLSVEVLVENTVSNYGWFKIEPATCIALTWQKFEEYKRGASINFDPKATPGYYSTGNNVVNMPGTVRYLQPYGPSCDEVMWIADFPTCLDRAKKLMGIVCHWGAELFRLPADSYPNRLEWEEACNAPDGFNLCQEDRRVYLYAIPGGYAIDVSTQNGMCMRTVVPIWQLLGLSGMQDVYTIFESGTKILVKYLNSRTCPKCGAHLE